MSWSRNTVQFNFNTLKIMNKLADPKVDNITLYLPKLFFAFLFNSTQHFLFEPLPVRFTCKALIGQINELCFLQVKQIVIINFNHPCKGLNLNRCRCTIFKKTNCFLPVYFIVPTEEKYFIVF